MVGRGCISDTSKPFSPVDQHWGAHAHYRHVASTEWNPDQEGCCLYSCIPISLAEAIQVNYVLNQIVLPYVLALAAWFAFLTPSMPPSCLIRLPLPDCSLKGLNSAMYDSLDVVKFLEKKRILSSVEPSFGSTLMAASQQQ